MTDDYTPTTDEVRYDVMVCHLVLRGGTEVNGRPQFAAWLAAHDREVAAKAWDEGYQARADEEDSEYVQYGSTFRVSFNNPYRADD